MLAYAREHRLQVRPDHLGRRPILLLYSDPVKRAAPALVVLLLVCLARPLAAQDAILIVRHAERADTPAVTLADGEYDNLFLVVPQPGAPPRLFRFRF